MRGLFVGLSRSQKIIMGVALYLAAAALYAVVIATVRLLTGFYD